jgi:hypothetical protein
VTTPVALGLALALVALLVADHLWLGWELPVFLGRQLVRLIEYLAFWR